MLLQAKVLLQEGWLFSDSEGADSSAPGSSVANDDTAVSDALLSGTAHLERMYNGGDVCDVTGAHADATAAALMRPCLRVQSCTCVDQFSVGGKSLVFQVTLPDKCNLIKSTLGCARGSLSNCTCVRGNKSATDIDCDAKLNYEKQCCMLAYS